MGVKMRFIQANEFYFNRDHIESFTDNSLSAKLSRGANKNSIRINLTNGRVVDLHGEAADLFRQWINGPAVDVVDLAHLDDQRDQAEEQVGNWEPDGRPSAYEQIATMPGPPAPPGPIETSRPGHPRLNIGNIHKNLRKLK